MLIIQFAFSLRESIIPKVAKVKNGRMEIKNYE